MFFMFEIRKEVRFFGDEDRKLKIELYKVCWLLLGFLFLC